MSVLMEINLQDDQETGLENLINVPVNLSNRKEFQKERQGSDLGVQMHDVHSKEKERRRRWTRLTGKENALIIRYVSKDCRMDTGNKKREWVLQDEEDETCDILENNKRLKGQEKFQQTNNLKVGVASLNCP